MFKLLRPSSGIPQRGLALLLCIVMGLTQVACMGPNDPIFNARPAPTSAEESTQETRKTSKTIPTVKERDERKSEEREVKEGETSVTTTGEEQVEAVSQTVEVTYDFSQEHQVNLADYAGVYYSPPALSENPPSMNGLHALIRQFLAERGLSGASISIVYDDLVNAERYSYNPDQRYVAASVIKVAAAMVVEQLRQEGAIPQDAQITYVPGEQFEATNLDTSRLGQTVSIDEMVSSALLYSDNAATSVLFEYFRRQGRDLHYFMDERCGTNYSGDISMSAREGIGLIEAMYYNQGEFPAYGSILGTMSGNSWGQYLTAGIPVGVSSKYGQLGSLNHEIGLVWTDSPFAYSVFTDNINAYAVLPELGALLYNYATGQVAIPDAPAIDPEESGEETPSSDPFAVSTEVPDGETEETAAQWWTDATAEEPTVGETYQQWWTDATAPPETPPAAPWWP